MQGLRGGRDYRTEVCIQNNGFCQIVKEKNTGNHWNPKPHFR